jgi:hypothetical protein
MNRLDEYLKRVKKEGESTIRPFGCTLKL